MLVVRENTEGTYAGEGGFLRKGTAARDRDPGLGQHADGRRALRALRVRPRAVARRASTSRSCTRRTCSRSPATCGSARSTRSRPSTPTSRPRYNHVDAACIYFVQDPGRYDVIVTDNLFGDILTDLAGAVAGGIGRAASANLNPARTGPSLFEPVHGSAPDIAGTGKADPSAAIISAAMMLEFLGEADAAARVRSAVDKSDDVTGTHRRHRHCHSREDLDMPFEKTEKIWMDGELVAVGRRQDPRAHAHACTTAPACSRASAPTRPPTARRSSGSPTTSCGCTTRRQALHDRRSRTRVEELVDATKAHGARSTGSTPATSGRSCTSATARWGSTRCRAQVNVSIAVWPWGSYLGDEGLEAGVRMKMSSWQRMDPNINPVAAKGTGMYINSSLAKVEALKVGLRRGDPAEHAGLRRRVHGREPLHREGRRAHHAAALERARSRASRATRS